MRSVLGICLAALTAAALASCGDSGPSTEEQVREAAVKMAESNDPKVYCRTMISAHYIDLAYEGKIEKCLGSDNSLAEDPGQARATAVVVDPEDETRAEVEVTIADGELGGTAGQVEMVEEDDRWKLDDVSDDYLRSAFLAEIKTIDEGVVAVPKMKVCFKRHINDLDAGELRELTFISDSGDKAATNAKLLEIAEQCPKGLAEYGAWEITKGLEEEGKRSPAFVECIRKEVTFLLELTDITPELLEEKPGFAAVAAFEGIVVGAKKNCLKTLKGGG